MELIWKRPLPAFAQQHLDNVEHVLQNMADVAPPADLRYRAFTYFAPAATRVVILGQDPYHTPGMATGLAFGVPGTAKLPPSLQNIEKNLKSFIPGYTLDRTLESWAKQGVLLLNTALSVTEGKALSHSHLDWGVITRDVVSLVSTATPHCVFILWGEHAAKFESLIDTSKHLVIKTSHPSPLSARKGFYACNWAGRANDWLDRQGLSTIQW